MMMSETTLPEYMRGILDSKNTTSPLGIYSICSSNPYVIEASIKASSVMKSPLLIESTCNQVNQFGGYTGLNPEKFVTYVQSLAEKYEFPFSSIYLGGDHLGPSVWSNLPSTIAINNSIEMIRQYVRAGYKKIHIDASMHCIDDPFPLTPDIIHKREAILCAAAVDECTKIGTDVSGLFFVVGTEVPTPGGSSGVDEKIVVSTVEDTIHNIDQTRKIFIEHGLEQAWQQTFAFVVQPGVEFGDSIIHQYDRKKALSLSKIVTSFDNLMYEAHSTDYQTRANLRMMVEDHFAILKVGPALTFAMREAIMSLESMERELYSEDIDNLSNVGSILDKAMCDHPDFWQTHYSTNSEIASFQRKYSYLDRSRYYWTNINVKTAMHRLLKNLASRPIPLSLLSFYLPMQYVKVRTGRITNTPQQLIWGKIIDVLADYKYAVGG